MHISSVLLQRGLISFGIINIMFWIVHMLRGELVTLIVFLIQLITDLNNENSECE